jgi:acetate kinase
MRILVVNAGSSSLKLRLLDDSDAVLRTAELAAGPDGLDRDALRGVLGDWERPDVVGHRIVHGGTRFLGPVVVDEDVRGELSRLVDLAPLHQPTSLAALDAVTTALPDAPSIACFDTAFHATIPAAAATYAVPLEWRERYGIRRYGFHGLSHAYCSDRVATLLGSPVGLRVVTCHLGGGASLAAVLDGRSVDTTMGFTPLEGLVMATRSGSVDPGLVLWLEEHEHLTPRAVATVLEERSGLLALAGTADMREVEAAAERADPAAALALDVYLHRLVAGIASMSAALGGLDALAFTGGVGENSAVVRRRCADRLGFLGARVEESANAGPEGDREISSGDSRVRTFVVAAREDVQIAREVRRLVAG